MSTKTTQKEDFDQLVEYEKKGILSSQIIESSDLAIKVKTLEGIITSWNRGSEKIYGYKDTEIIGKHINILTPLNEQNSRHELSRRISEGHVIPRHITKGIRKDGVVIDLSIHLSPVKDEKGKVIGIATIDKDITELAAANKELDFQNQEKGKRADELDIANKELIFQNEEKEKRAAELGIANKELAFQNNEKEKRANELIAANIELAFQDKEKGKRADELFIANRELLFQNEEKGKRADELVVANKELDFQNKEKGKRADELDIANKELLFQNQEKGKRADELDIANKELDFQNKEKGKRADELDIANKELIFQNEEKEKRAAELGIANKELAFQNDEKEKRANELIAANIELAFQDKEKGKRADELFVANRELLFQNEEKGKRADELVVANKELDFQNREKGKRADELDIANKELLFQNQEKEKRAEELYIANKELIFQNEEKEKRAAELVLADIELDFQKEEKHKREIENRELEAFSNSQKLASQYARSLIEASADPLFTISPLGKITDMNQATARVRGLSREQLINSDFFECFTEPDKARAVYEQVFAKGFVVDYPLTIKDHKFTDVLFNGSVYKDDRGNVIGAVLVARDITDQKRNEKELTEAKVFAELAAGIAEEAKGKAESAKRIAEDATRIAKEAVKAKQQFLSNMSHEIRTPMNAIIGFTKVVLKTELTEKQKEYLSAIKVSGDALIVLINDILDLAKVDAGKMIFEHTPFKMASSISAMLHLFETKIQEKNLKLISEYDKNIPEVLVGDAVRLHQIILNLVSNAVKFTNEGEIIVSVKLLKEDANQVTIQFSISDTGIGIAENKIDRVFEDFQQATSDTSRLYGGTGLGLAIVKQLVEPQGGTISVKSKINEGTTFSFILPFQKTKAEAQTEKATAEIITEIKDIKVLVVEDIALNQLLMKTLLDDFGFERDIANNGKIAIELLEAKSYDIILMDLQMPVMNGFEATEYIRNKMNSKIPIIALTADVTTVDLEKCKAVGMNDYVAKPVDERILYSKIVELVKKPIPVLGSKAVKKRTPEKIKQGKLKYTNLDQLNKRTKSNPILMMEMISLYLEQTPPLIKEMKNGLLNENLDSVHAAAHKMIPSFSIMGMNLDFEEVARKIQQYAKMQHRSEEMHAMVAKLELVCMQACAELEEEFKMIKNNSNG